MHCFLQLTETADSAMDFLLRNIKAYQDFYYIPWHREKISLFYYLGQVFLEHRVMIEVAVPRLGIGRIRGRTVYAQISTAAEKSAVLIVNMEKLGASAKSARGAH